MASSRAETDPHHSPARIALQAFFAGKVQPSDYGLYSLLCDACEDTIVKQIGPLDAKMM